MKLWTWKRENLPSLSHAFRTALAVTISILLGRLVGLPEGYWAAIATVVVMQSPLGDTVPLAIERIVASALGASCTDSSDGNRVQFDYFVVRLRIGFERTDEIDVIADRLLTLVARLRIDTYKEWLKHETKSAEQRYYNGER
jgi:hypothetical protein